MKKSSRKFLEFFLVFTVAVGWIFSGWPRAFDFPPKIEKIKAAPAFTARTAQYAQGSSLTGAFDFTVNKATGTVDGDIMFMFLSVYVASPPTIDSVPSNWTQIATNTTGNNRWYLYYKIASGEGANYTWSLSASSRYLAVNIAYSAGAFDVQSISDVTAISNTLYGTGNTTVRAASMNVPAVNSPLVFFGSVYNTTVRTFTAPSVPTADWVEDFDYGNVTPDLSSTIDSMVWTGSGLTGDMDATCSASITTNKHAFAIALKPLPLPSAPTLYPDDGGSNQIAFSDAREFDTTPIIRASATFTASFNRFQVEFNTASDFSGTAYTETFSGTYSSGTQYNLQTTGTLGLPSTNGVTYFVRARASSDGGTYYGDWSSGTWAYTYKSSGNPDWFQTADAQFASGTLSNIATSGSGSVTLGANAIAKAGTDASHTDAGAIASTSFSHTLVSGSNRLVVVSIGLENNGDNDISSVTYGGVSMTKAVDATTGTSGYIYTNDIWYLLEASLPTDGSKTVQLNFSATGSTDLEVNALASEYVGVNQSAPEATDPAVWSSGSSITNSISPSAGAWVISSWGIGNTGNVTSSDNGQVEAIDFTDSSSNFAVLELQGATGSETSLSSTFSATINRGTRVAASWVAISASSGTIMSPEIDFDWVTGQGGWGDVSFSTTETNGDVKLKVYYTASTACDTIVPDGALSGNSSGFDVTASPISLSGLTPVASTYNKICLQATLTFSGGTPYLNDWGVSWSAGIISISVSDGVVSYGTLAANTSLSTCSSELNDAQIVTNNGTVTENFNIKGSNSANWTLSGSQGNEQYVHEFLNGSCSTFSGGTALTVTDQTLAAGISSSGTATLNLQLDTPTQTTHYDQQSVNVTITAVQQ